MCAPRAHVCRQVLAHSQTESVHFSSWSSPSFSCELSASLASYDSLPCPQRATSHVRNQLQVTSGTWTDGLLCTTAAEWTVGRKGLQVRTSWEMCSPEHRAW